MGRNASGVSEQLARFAPLLTAGVPFGLLLKTLELPSAAAWEATGGATVALGVLAVLATWASWTANRANKRTKRDAILFEGCQRIAARIDDLEPALPLKSVGVHVWLVKTPLLRGQTLERGPEFRLQKRVQSGVVLTPGKGVVGRAWAEKADCLVDLEPLHVRVEDQRAFEALSAAERLGLDWSDYQRAKEYKAIWASALVHHGRVIAVVSVDIRDAGFASVLDRALDDDTVQNVLATCQDVLVNGA